MNENVDDLEKAIKVIATIPEKSDQDEDEQDKPNEAVLTPAASPMPTMLGESSDKLSKMLKNVLQAKVMRHLLLIIMCPFVNTLSVFVRQDYFDVIESNGKAEERFIFLFKTRMFITEINKNISESQRTYNVRKIVKVSQFCQRRALACANALLAYTFA